MNNKVSLMGKIYISFLGRNVCKGESKPISPKSMELHWRAGKPSHRKASARLDGQAFVPVPFSCKIKIGKF